MSSFRLICIAALTAAMVIFVVDAAAAQSTTDQAGKAYLAGLRPPHEHPKGAHVKTTRLESPHNPTAKSTQQTTKPTVTAKSKAHHRRVRLADKINSRIAWPSVEPSAADQPATPEGVLQFATEDATPTSATSAPAVSAPATPARAASVAGAAPRVTMPAPPSAPQTAPGNIAVTERHDSADPIAAEKPRTTTTVAQTERLEASAPRQMRVIAPALSEAPVAASTPSDQSPARSGSAVAQMMATLAGAIAACIAAFLIFGFRSSRIRQL